MPTKADTGARRTEQLERIAEELPTRAAVLVRLLVKQMRGLELARTEMEVLSILREGPRTITELTELVGTAQPTMTLLVKRLAERGLLAREGQPGDGRVVIAKITPQGSAAQARARARAAATVRMNLEELSDQQVRDLAAASETLGSFVAQLQTRA
jgi:DNA-binding MarR family transcriptional regulator